MDNNIFIKNSIFKSKDNILMIIGMVIFLCILFHVINSSLILIKTFSDYKTKNIDNRQLIAFNFNTKNNEADIKDITHVTQVSLYGYGNTVISTDKYNTIELIGINNKELSNIKISSGERKIGDGNIICPEEFITMDDSDNAEIRYYTYSSKNIINTSFNAIINYYEAEDTRVIVKDTMKKNLIISGTYNSKEYMNNNNVCYSSIDDMKEIMDFMSGNSIQTNTYSVIVDSIDNLAYVKEELESKGYSVKYKTSVDVFTITLLITIISIIIILILFIISLIINHSIRRDIINKQKEISLFKAIGYSNKQVLKIYKLEYGIIFIISFVISIIFSITTFLVIKNTVANLFELKIFTIKIHSLSIIVLIIVGLIYSEYIVIKNINKILLRDRIEI